MKKSGSGTFIWAYLLHLGYNFWSDREATGWDLTHVSATSKLRMDKNCGIRFSSSLSRPA